MQATLLLETKVLLQMESLREGEIASCRHEDDR
jgi:hypothetical protein